MFWTVRVQPIVRRFVLRWAAVGGVGYFFGVWLNIQLMPNWSVIMPK